MTVLRSIWLRLALAAGILAACASPAPANDYYTATTVSRHTLARAEAENSDRAAVEAAFDKLPSLNDLTRESATYGADTGAANAYVVALNKTLTAYSAGLSIAVKIGAGNTNTGASTINVDGLGARSIKLPNGNDPAAGDLPAGGIMELRYDGTNFQLMSGSLIDPASAFELVSDTSPQLGANLDVNSHSITATSGANVELSASGGGQIQFQSAIVTVDAVLKDRSTNTKIDFSPGGVEELDIYTNNVERMNINNSGMLLGASGARVSTILDEDDMATDSATALATQQSIKAYVDTMWDAETALTPSAVTTAEFTGLRAGIKEIIVDLYQISTNGTSPVTIEVGRGSTIWNTSDYDTKANDGASGSTTDTTAIALTGTVAATDQISGQIRLRLLTSVLWSVSGEIYVVGGGASYFISGRFSSGSELTAVRLNTVGGTDQFDAGTVALEHRVGR